MWIKTIDSHHPRPELAWTQDHRVGGCENLHFVGYQLLSTGFLLCRIRFSSPIAPTHRQQNVTRPALPLQSVIRSIPGDIISYYRFIGRVVKAPDQQLAFTCCLRETAYCEMLKQHPALHCCGAAQSKTVRLCFFCHHRASQNQIHWEETTCFANTISFVRSLRLQIILQSPSWMTVVIFLMNIFKSPLSPKSP